MLSLHSDLSEDIGQEKIQSLSNEQGVSHALGGSAVLKVLHPLIRPVREGYMDTQISAWTVLALLDHSITLCNITKWLPFAGVRQLL